MFGVNKDFMLNEGPLTIFLFKLSLLLSYYNKFHLVEGDLNLQRLQLSALSTELYCPHKSIHKYIVWTM